MNAVESNLVTNTEFQHKLNENWLITGTIDVLIKEEDLWNDDKYIYEIHENKLAYNYTFTKFMENVSTFAVDMGSGL